MQNAYSCDALPSMDVAFGIGDARPSASFDSANPVINPIPAIIIWGPQLVVMVIAVVVG